MLVKPWFKAPDRRTDMPGATGPSRKCATSISWSNIIHNNNWQSVKLNHHHQLLSESYCFMPIPGCHCPTLHPATDDCQWMLDEPLTAQRNSACC